MTSFQVEVDNRAAEALVEAQSGGGKFPPGLKGEYQAHVVPLKKDGDRVQVQNFGGSGANAKKKVLRVAARVIDESPALAKRQFFLRVPLFTRYAPTERNPQGAPARMYFDFWRALGVADDDLVAGRLPDVDYIMGRRIALVLSEPLEPNEWNPLGYNEVSFVNKAGNVSTTPVRKPGESVAPWLTPDDDIIEGYEFQTPAAQALYGGEWAQPAAAAQQAAPSWGQAPAEGGTVTPGPWAQPNPEVQAAAMTGTSF